MSSRKITLDNIGDIGSILRNLIKIDTAERIDRSTEKVKEYHAKKAEIDRRYSKIQSELAHPHHHHDPEKEESPDEEEDSGIEIPGRKSKKSRFLKPSKANEIVEKEAQSPDFADVTKPYASDSKGKSGWRSKMREWFDQGAPAHISADINLRAIPNRPHCSKEVELSLPLLPSAVVVPPETFTEALSNEQTELSTAISSESSVDSSAEATATFSIKPHESTSLKWKIVRQKRPKKLPIENTSTTKFVVRSPANQQAATVVPHFSKRRIRKRFRLRIKRLPEENVSKSANFAVPPLVASRSIILQHFPHLKLRKRNYRQQLPAKIPWRERHVTSNIVIRNRPQRTLYGTSVSIKVPQVVRTKVRGKFKEQANKRYIQHVRVARRFRLKRKLTRQTITAVLPDREYDRVYFDSRRPRKYGPVRRVSFKFPQKVDTTVSVFRKPRVIEERVQFTVQKWTTKIMRHIYNRKTPKKGSKPVFAKLTRHGLRNGFIIPKEDIIVGHCQVEPSFTFHIPLAPASRQIGNTPIPEYLVYKKQPSVRALTPPKEPEAVLLHKTRPKPLQLPKLDDPEHKSVVLRKATRCLSPSVEEKMQYFDENRESSVPQENRKKHRKYKAASAIVNEVKRQFGVTLKRVDKRLEKIVRMECVIRPRGRKPKKYGMGEHEEEPEEEEHEVEEAHDEEPAVEEQEHEAEPAPTGEKELTETELAIIAAKKKHEEEEAIRLKEYEEQRKLQKQKEEEELAALKEKQERRRREREEEEAMMAERAKAEEERRKQEEEERKKRIEADKAKKEAEKAKRQAMMALQGAPGAAAPGGGPNYSIAKKGEGGDKFDKLGNIIKAKGEMGLTKEQLEEQKQKFLREYVPALSLEGLDIGAIRGQIKGLHERICRLEAETYDLEKRKERQEYDLKEMNERQRMINRNKALRKGLDPDASNSRFPPKIPVASKFERQVDRRSYGDRRHMFEHPKSPPKPNIFHGSARPPSEWGRKDNEELEIVRKNLEPFKYVEQVVVEGALPPMEVTPTSYEEGAQGEDDEYEEGNEEEGEE